MIDMNYSDYLSTAAVLLAIFAAAVAWSKS